MPEIPRDSLGVRLIRLQQLHAHSADAFASAKPARPQNQYRPKEKQVMLTGRAFDLLLLGSGVRVWEREIELEIE